MSNFKKNIIWLPLIFLFFWAMISVGMCMREVSSREPLADVRITINTVDGINVNPDVVAKLVRADNNIKLIKINTSTWAVGGVFIERLAIAADDSQLLKIKDVVVAIDNRDFRYTQSELLAQWEKVSLATFGPVTTNEKASIFASPYLLSLERSKIPVKKDFFSSILNWRGDDYLTRNTLGRALLPSLIFSVWLFVFYIIYLSCFNGKLPIVDDKNNERRQGVFVTLFLTLIFTIIAELVLFYLINRLYHPDILSIINRANELYLDGIVLRFTPKPVEQRQFLLGVMSCPFLLIINYFLSVKLVSRWLKNKVNTINSMFILAIILGLPAFIYLALSMSDFVYIKSSLSYSLVGFAVFVFIIFPVLLYAVVKEKKQKWLFNILAIELAFVLVATVILNVSSPVGSNWSDLFDAVYFPQTQIAHGKAIVQQVPSLYGLFPLFLKPIFDIIGLGVVNFTIVMGILILITYLCLLAFLKVSTKDKVIPLLGILSILEYSYLSNRITSGSYGLNFQHMPIRILLSAAILYVSSRYLSKPNRYIYSLGHLLAAVAIFWNFDSGMVVFASWILFLLYLEVWQRADKKWFEIAKAMLKHLLIGLGSLLTATFLLSLYFIFNTGNLPNVNLFFQYSKLFYAGFALVPLPIFPHMWHLVILVYLTSLLLSIYCLIKDNKNIKGPLYFILSIVGFGLFAYFEARAINLNLIEPSFVTFLILVLFLDDLLVQIRDCFGRCLKVPLFIFFTTLIILFILTLPAINVIKNANYFIKNLSKTYAELYTPANMYLSKNIAFIKKNTISNERIIILAAPEKGEDGIYFGETNTVSAIDFPSSVDLYFKYQFDEFLSYIKSDHHTKIFVNSDYDNVQILEILNSKYKKFISDTGMVMFVK